FGAQYRALTQAGGRPGADHRVLLGETAGRHLERDRGHVLVGDRVGLAVARAHRVQVHEVEDLAEVHHEPVLALPDEYAPRGRAAGDADGVHEVRGVRRIVRDRLVADVVDGLEEGMAAEGRIPDGLVLTRARVTTYQLDAVALREIEVVALGIHRTDVGERHGDLLAAGV